MEIPKLGGGDNPHLIIPIRVSPQPGIKLGEALLDGGPLEVGD